MRLEQAAVQIALHLFEENTKVIFIGSDRLWKHLREQVITEIKADFWIPTVDVVSFHPTRHDIKYLRHYHSADNLRGASLGMTMKAKNNCIFVIGDFHRESFRTEYREMRILNYLASLYNAEILKGEWNF